MFHMNHFIVVSLFLFSFLVTTWASSVPYNDLYRNLPDRSDDLHEKCEAYFSYICASSPKSKHSMASNPFAIITPKNANGNRRHLTDESRHIQPVRLVKTNDVSDESEYLEPIPLAAVQTNMDREPYYPELDDVEEARLLQSKPKMIENIVVMPSVATKQKSVGRRIAHKAKKSAKKFVGKAQKAVGVGKK